MFFQVFYLIRKVAFIHLMKADIYILKNSNPFEQLNLKKCEPAKYLLIIKVILFILQVCIVKSSK